MNREQIVLPWFNKLLNPNTKAHWAEKAIAKKKQKLDAIHITKLSIPPAPADLYHLSILFCPPDHRCRDIDNCLAAIKNALDGVAEACKVNDKQFRYKKIDFGDVVKNGKIIISYEY